MCLKADERSAGEGRLRFLQVGKMRLIGCAVYLLFGFSRERVLTKRLFA